MSQRTSSDSGNVEGYREMDLVTRYTVVLPERLDRGAVSVAARANHVIRKALEADGFKLAERPGHAVDPAISTDCHRLEYIEARGVE